MARRKIDGAEALTELLARLPDGPVSDAVRSEVAKLRRAAVQRRTRPKTERQRLLQGIADAERDYLAARAEAKHAAADRARRHRLELERELVELDTPTAVRPDAAPTSPSLDRVQWLESHLAEIERDLLFLRTTGQWSLVPTIDARACALHEELARLRLARQIAGSELDLIVIDDPVQTPRAVYLERLLQQATADREAARRGGRMTALAQLTRTCLDLRNLLDLELSDRPRRVVDTAAAAREVAGELAELAPLLRALGGGA